MSRKAALRAIAAAKAKAKDKAATKSSPRDTENSHNKPSAGHPAGRMARAASTNAPDGATPQPAPGKPGNRPPRPASRPRNAADKRAMQVAAADDRRAAREAAIAARQVAGKPTSVQTRKINRPASATAGPSGPSEPMRIARAIARAGLCSRREAERLIEEGRVVVNGMKLNTPAIEVAPGDKIVVDGHPLPAAEPVKLWRYHKPKGLVTTNNDPEGRQTVFDNLPADMPRVVSIGRLDFNTEGLLLLTNDGALSRHLELPSTGWLRRYRVRAWGDVTQERLDKLKNGIEYEGLRYGPMEATLDSTQGHNTWLTIGLREGKNREVRNVMEALGLEVNRLIRVSYGPFQLTDLKPGEAEAVKRRVLCDQLGAKLASEFGLDKQTDDEVGTSRRNRPPKRKPAAK